MLKSEMIHHLQNELKRIRDYHENMIKAYESKMSELNIPVEEMGFTPIIPYYPDQEVQEESEMANN